MIFAIIEKIVVLVLFFVLLNCINQNGKAIQHKLDDLIKVVKEKNIDHK